MTEPPYEWPASTTGPSIDAISPDNAAESPARLRSPLGAASKRRPARRSRGMTPDQPADAANAPCTRTTVVSDKRFASIDCQRDAGEERGGQGEDDSVGDVVGRADPSSRVRRGTRREQARFRLV